MTVSKIDWHAQKQPTISLHDPQADLSKSNTYKTLVQTLFESTSRYGATSLVNAWLEGEQVLIFGSESKYEGVLVFIRRS